MLYISFHVHWSEINAYNSSGFHSDIAEGRVFWDVTHFQQQIAYVSRGRNVFTINERILKHVFPFTIFGEGRLLLFLCIFISLFTFTHSFRSRFIFFLSSFLL
jgi:hypothetical protein